MQAFPQPLSVEEENEYIKRWEQGDREARTILIEHNLRLVAYLVKKYTHSTEQAYKAVGKLLEIVKVCSVTNNDIRLATYASRCIDNELLMTFRSDKKQSKEVFLYEPIGGDDGEGNSLSFLDILESVDEDIPERMEKEENISKLYGLIEENLTEREKLIIRLRYGVPERPRIPEHPEVTQREIARQLGISRSYVSRIEKKALQKLRRAYEKVRGC